MKIISIMKNDCVNSITGFTLTLFISGCEHHCEGCFSKQTWNKDIGDEYSIDEVFEMVKNSRHKNVSFIGGDPLNPHYREEVLTLIKKIKNELNKTIYVWTGYEKELVEQWIDLKYIDYLIEGKFILAKRDIRLPLRGSSNQRIFNLGKDITVEIDNRQRMI